MKNFKKIKKDSGAAMITVVIFFVFISMAIISGLIVPSVREFKISSESINSKKSYYLAESGVEDAFYRILTGKPISSSETLTLDSNSTDTDMISTSNTKEIISTGDVLNYQRKLNLLLTAGNGVSFNYGVQAGQGGIEILGSSGINGNVYANGPIKGSGSAFITGTAVSANSPDSIELAIDQSSGSNNPNVPITFGKVNSTKDVAQSFETDSSIPFNKTEIYIKKVGTPNNITVKIVNDVGGKPGTTVYTSGTLSASLVTTSYSWVEVSFSPNITLNTNTKYWLVLQPSSAQSTKYYVIGASTTGDGLVKTGQLTGSWFDTNPISRHFYLKVYLGGANGLITGVNQDNQLNIGTINSDNTQAHSVSYTESSGPIYCQVGTGNNKSCTSQADPVYIAYPVSDGNITEWKEGAESGGTYSGTYSTANNGTSNLGPKKINGDLIVNGDHILYITGTIWVTGNVTVSGNTKIVVGSSYGNAGGILISDGWLNLGASGQLNGNGQTGSYLLFVTTSSGNGLSCSGNPSVICVSGNAGSVVLNAQKGTIVFIGSAHAKEATGNKILLSGNSIVDYESGIANTSFTSGPSGGWQIKNWEETE